MLYINELFASIQGEGSYTGTPSVFIRFQGCKCQCSFCDTKHTWKLGEPNDKPLSFALQKADCAHYATTTAKELAATIAEKFPKIKHVVMTGGEPCLFDLAPLCDLLEKQGRTVQIETSGTEPIGSISKTVWVTVSPKIDQAGGRKVLPEALARANEIKMAVATQKEIDQLRNCLSHAPGALIYLQPISQGPRLLNSVSRPPWQTTGACPYRCISTLRCDDRMPGADASAIGERHGLK